MPERCVSTGRARIVHTIDVITPIVDDPATFGRVAAANAVSDIYAMGGDPMSAVSLLSVPKELPSRAIRPMMKGAAEVLRLAGAHLIGGHTLKDKELKLGFAVTGTVLTKQLVANRGAKPKQRLLLTKALGTGVLYQAMKAGVRTAKQTKALVQSMTTLNRLAKEAMLAARVRCGTDVTGFGLAGHALNIARASDVDVILSASALPALEGVLEHLAAGIFPSTTAQNVKGYGSSSARSARFRRIRSVSRADPQTSGGMLMVVDPRNVAKVQATLTAYEIGEIRPKRAEKPTVRLAV